MNNEQTFSKQSFFTENCFHNTEKVVELYFDCRHRKTNNKEQHTYQITLLGRDTKQV